MYSTTSVSLFFKVIYSLKRYVRQTKYHLLCLLNTIFVHKDVNFTEPFIFSVSVSQSSALSQQEAYEVTLVQTCSTSRLGLPLEEEAPGASAPRPPSGSRVSFPFDLAQEQIYYLTCLKNKSYKPSFHYRDTDSSKQSVITFYFFSETFII